MVLDLIARALVHLLISLRHVHGAYGPQVIEGGLAIVPQQPPLVPAESGRSFYSGVFGGQMTLPSTSAASRIGMRTIRTSGAIWKQTQPVECWDDSCFNWAHYDDGYFALAGW